MTVAAFSIPPLPSDADPDEFDSDAPQLLRSWRLRLGFDDLESLSSAVKLEVSTLADIEAGVRPVKRRYLYQQLGGRLRTAAERRDRRIELTATQRIALEAEKQQTSALGAQLARTLWGTSTPDDAWNVILGAVNERLTPEFWTTRRKIIALMRTLESLTVALQTTEPDRDAFPFIPRLSMAEMIP